MRWHFFPEVEYTDPSERATTAKGTGLCATAFG
jgi:hypothetical protein